MLDVESIKRRVQADSALADESVKEAEIVGR